MGSVNLDNTGSGSAITLSSDGTSLLLDGTAIGGGGGADLYAANESSPAAQPSATGTNAIAIGDSAVATNTGAISLGKSLASGYTSLAAQISNNTNTYGSKEFSSIAMSDRAKADAYYAVAIGKQTVASGTQSVSIGGGEASSNKSISLGFDSVANGNNSVVLGTDGNARGTTGKIVFGGAGGYGDARTQSGILNLSRATTDATATDLTSGGSSVSSTNQLLLPINSAFAFTGIVVARQKVSDGTSTGAWKVEGLIRQEGTIATTTLVVSTVTAISAPAGWAVALTADTTRGALVVKATGAASTNIRWAANITSSEVQYA
tara:strand:+ start:3628 stop:4587 length:960 start_codon:yes stop_codon:yes gene_type:complete